MQTPRPDDGLQTVQLRDLMARLQSGDEAALEELLRRSAARLERMARAMLRRYPRVREHDQTGDVVNEAMLTFLGALRRLTFASTRDFYGLAAEHVRRRLLDLARRYARPGGDVAALETVMGGAGRVAAREEDAEEMERWQALHEAVGALPAEVREVFALRFYQGWQNPQIAELLQVSTKQVTRLYLRAEFILKEKLGGRPLPGGGKEPPA